MACWERELLSSEGTLFPHPPAPLDWEHLREPEQEVENAG